MKIKIKSLPSTGLAAAVIATLALTPTSQAQTVWFADGDISPGSWTDTASWFANDDGTGGNPTSVQGSGDIFDANGYTVNSDDSTGVTNFNATIRLSGNAPNGGTAGRLQMRANAVSVDALESTGSTGVNFIQQAGPGVTTATLTVGTTTIDTQLRPRADGDTQIIDFGDLSGTGDIASIFLGDYTFRASGSTENFTGAWILNDGTNRFGASGLGASLGLADFDQAELRIDDTVATSSLEVDRDIYVNELRITDTSGINTITSGTFSGTSLTDLTPDGSIVDQGGTLFVGQTAPIPEPSAFALLAGVSSALLVLRRRR